jgi:hypothetical protein
MNADENMCNILAARKIAHVYMDDVSTIGKKLQKAIDLYESNQGPVVILATHQVLESTVKIDNIVRYPKGEISIGRSNAETKHLAHVMDLINNKKINFLWQCGDVTNEERELVYEIAEKAGIALCDSINYPGSLSKYYKGRINKNYLGTFGLYCFSRPIYNFLTKDTRLKPKNEQCLFFLKSKIPQIATPFSEGKLRRELFIGQVNHDKRHIAPFVNIPIVASVISFLNYIKENMNIKGDILEFRKQTIQEAKIRDTELVAGLSALPMYPNYFYKQLNDAIEELIETKNYQYTGVFDVGRCGVSAMRNVSRTGSGFSGWYGRAIMGDAYSSINSIATISDKNIIGFIGDGAYNLVPDFRPYLIENLLSSGINSRKNISIFILLNGTLSIINTYRYQRFLDGSGRSGVVSSLIKKDESFKIKNYTINIQNMLCFEKEKIQKLLLKNNTINYFYVKIAHNNEGDGISLLWENSWVYQNHDG